MVTRSRIEALAAGLTLALLAACGPAGLAAEGAAGETSVGTQSASAPLLVLMASAPQTVAHSGQKLFQTYWTDSAGSQSLVYTETVAANGQGQIAVKALDLIAPVLPSGEEAQFLIKQEIRQRTMYFVRDFAIRDIEAFTTSYSLVDTGVPVVVAGVSGVRLEIQKRVNPTVRYVVDVDPTNGLVLRAREELLDGTLVAKSEFTSLTYTPDLNGVSWAPSHNNEVQLTLTAGTLAQQLGFNPREPKLIPDGWVQIGIAKVEDTYDQRTWARRTYSDGVEQVFFLVAKGKGPGHQLSGTTGGGPPSGDPDRLRRLSVGPWTVLEANLAQGDVIVFGRAPDTVLYDLIQSAFF